MSTTPVRPDDSIPYGIGFRYRLGNSSMGGQWVEIYAMDWFYIYARGIDNHQADLKIPRWKFDDIVADYVEVPL